MASQPIPWFACVAICDLFLIGHGATMRSEFVTRFKSTADTSSHRSILRSLTIPVSVEHLWNAIATPGVLERCHPFVKDNPVQHWSGVDSRDTVRYYSGLTLHRRITRWMHGVGYDLDAVDPRGLSSAHVQWRTHAVRERTSTLTISIEPDLLRRTPGRIVPYLSRFYVHPFLSSYLDVVLKGFEYHVVTGKSVRRNQFGWHPAFSLWTLKKTRCQVSERQ